MQETTGARGASAAADAASSFITETVYRQELPSEYVIEYVPIDPAPSITLTNLRTMIAWVDGGDGIASYEDCVLSVISYKQFFRDWEAFYQRTWKTQQAESQVASGAGERTTVHTYGNSRDPGYSEVWLTGPDMDLFRAEIVDDYTDPSNGYTDTIMTARPLPAGVYNITNHSRLYEYIACDFHPENNQLRWEVTRWEVTAMASDGVVHEAFFDPVAVGTAVGADAVNGVCSPSLSPLAVRQWR